MAPHQEISFRTEICAHLDAHTDLSTKALNSEIVRFGLKDILLHHSGLWEALRAKLAS